MKKIEAQTLEDALIVAAKTFNCSVVDLDYEIIQNPSKGFLGLGRKQAVICAQVKNAESKMPESPQNYDFVKTLKKDSINCEQAIESKREMQKEYDKKGKKPAFTQKELQEISKVVQKELDELLAMLPYKLDSVIVEPYDENTLYVKIDGEDSALLIGKEGYRYKAISYLIFNWVNHIYGLMIRLEIAEFLRNQEEMIANYLLPTIESVKLTGKAQTKPLDGVLAHIALKQLREQFPDKYVSFRINSEGERYIIINAFYHS
ncbi:Jag N-terminal domain-containing protein [Helicobacter turcicus]|uniref:Jag N-terminal domain-containing protein n=1 Tax=Helicobacter turcicus TaxID=2867412 RepID=A0ABS7JLU0_9HELI|nr:Jag N-terminal domain-containing protein [Helicobacter turcicus]MBX7490346.1 Jag N-terminal domain-containing protein [Helicobacter turcicus]MBX7545075.1 Jag N-terminal domain-containing protein [Helicobacter turcicus]